MDRTGACAAGLQQALKRSGLPEFMHQGHGWELHHAIERSGKFVQIPLSEAQEGDIGFRRNPGGYGHCFTFVGRNRHGNLMEASDHITAFNPDNPRYDRTIVYRRIG
jgi:hypothetical protein